MSSTCCEGSVRQSGNRIRVTAQLIKVADGFHVWSERYDRELTDIFAVQDEITQAIATALQMRLAPTAAPRPYTPNLRAYEAYLKSRDYWFKPSPDSLARVKESLEHAIELDPKFALAYSMLGIYYTMLSGLGNRPAREVIPMARAAELEALRVDPSLPEAHAILGVCDGIDYEWHEAARRWRLAMAREPISRDIRFWYGNHYLLPIGRVDEAVEAMTWGLELDPLNLLYRHHLALGLRHAGRLEDAESELRKVLELDENFAMALETLGAICAQQGRFEEALALTERAHAFMPWAKSDRRTARRTAASRRRQEPVRCVARGATAWRGILERRRGWPCFTPWAGTSISLRNQQRAPSKGGIRYW